MANAQHTLFLDCSTFTYCVYLNTFGYQLESNLTWHIPEMVTPCVWERTTTHNETPQEKQEIIAQLKAILQPGDLLNLLKIGGSGHIVLYIGNEEIFHSRAAGPNSYRYEALHDGIYDHGTIYRDPVDKMLDDTISKRTIFSADIAGCQVLRPIEKVGDPTPIALSRAGKSKDLVLSVLSSHPGGATAWVGDTVTYTLTVSNVGTEARLAEGNVQGNSNLTLLGSENSYRFDVPAGETVQKEFHFRLGNDTSPVCQSPAFTVNDIPVWAERVLVAPKMDRAALDHVISEVQPQGDCLYDCVVRAYAHAGIQMEKDVFRTLLPLFRLLDGAAGDVLWRFPQEPTKDMALYSYFGGTGVITPELSAIDTIRVHRILPRDLQPGDIVLISEDASLRQVNCLFVTHDGILSQFCGNPIEYLTGDAVDKLVDTLPGRFCYIVLRPQQSICNPANNSLQKY